MDDAAPQIAVELVARRKNVVLPVHCLSAPVIDNRESLLQRRGLYKKRSEIKYII